MVKFFKRVITLYGKRTSLRLCEIEWQILENISRYENLRRNQLIELIKSHKSQKLGLTPAIRLFMLTYLNALHQKRDKAEIIDLMALIK